MSICILHGGAKAQRACPGAHSTLASCILECCLMPLQATPSPTTNYFFPGVTPWGFCFLHPRPRPSMRSPSQICLFVPCIPFLMLSVPDIPQGALSTSPSTNWRPGTVLMMEMTWPWQIGDGCLEGPGDLWCHLSASHRWACALLGQRG